MKQPQDKPVAPGGWVRRSHVSVVVPTRNSERFLAACLQSVRNQTYKTIEVIVVDNQSADGTIDIARRFADQVETCGPERSSQRNRGAYLARGSYLLFVDSDMILDPNVIADCVTIAENDSVAGVIVPEISIGHGFWARCRALERSCYVGDDLVEAARFFPRSTFETIGGFDEGLIAGEDWDLTARARDYGRIARTRSHILHDEGELRLRAHLAKKAYYARAFRPYWKKHPALARQQANLIFRPAFARHWRRLAKHPTLTLGFLTLKAFEQGASVWGLATSRNELLTAKGSPD
jgi:glycosyltransferase involved in cell wall biosynthesis